jgi:hypothetical protein
MDQVWVCGNCRSINQPRESRCYRCRTPRAIGEADPTAMPVSGQVPRRDNAATIPPYQSTAAIAQLAGILILVTIGVVGASGLVLFLGRLNAAAGEATTLLGSDAFLPLTILQGAVVAAALVTWGTWLSRVAANVPALTGEFPNVPPSFVFLQTLVPVANLYWIPSILRDLMAKIQAGGRGEALMIGAWLCLVGAILLPRLNVAAALIAPELGEAVESIAVIGLVAIVLQAVGGVLLFMLTQHIESVAAARAAALPEHRAPSTSAPTPPPSSPPAAST